RPRSVMPTAWSRALRKDVGRDGGAAQKAGVIQWREAGLVRGDTTSARKAGGAGRIEASAATRNQKLSRRATRPPTRSVAAIVWSRGSLGECSEAASVLRLALRNHSA